MNHRRCFNFIIILLDREDSSTHADKIYTGCDGVTYMNTCYGNKNGVSTFVMGKCGNTNGSVPYQIKDLQNRTIIVTVKPSAKATLPPSLKPTTRKPTNKATMKPSFKPSFKPTTKK